MLSGLLSVSNLVHPCMSLVIVFIAKLKWTLHDLMVSVGRELGKVLGWDVTCLDTLAPSYSNLAQGAAECCMSLEITAQVPINHVLISKCTLCVLL